MNAPLIFGITLNWNRRDDTLKCLESLVKSDFPNFRILVVDNGSEDGSPEAIKEHYPSVEQMINGKNLGFAGGFNQGFKYALNAGAEYILIVNNDTIVAPDMLNLLY